MSEVVVTVGWDTERAVTDDNGRFDIEEISEGTYTVSASKEGYRKTSRK